MLILVHAAYYTGKNHGKISGKFCMFPKIFPFFFLVIFPSVIEANTSNITPAMEDSHNTSKSAGFRAKMII